MLVVALLLWLVAVGVAELLSQFLLQVRLIFLPFCDAFLKGVSILKYKGRTLLLKNCSFYKKTRQFYKKTYFE